MGYLQVDDAQFWGDPFAARAEVLDSLGRQGAVGVCLDGPTRVRCDLRSTLPVAGFLRARMRDARAHPLRARAVVVVARRESHEVFVGRLFPWKDPIPRAARGDDDSAGTVTDFFAAELRAMLPGLPWRAGTLDVTVVIDDWRSNTLTVMLEDKPEDDAAVAAFVAAHRSVGYPRAVTPRGAGVVHRPWLPEDGPQTPGVVASRSGEGRVAGQWMLPILPRERVRPREAHDDQYGQLGGAGWVEVGDRDAVAVVPMTWLVLGTKAVEPMTETTEMPAYATWQGDDGQLWGAGRFEVPLAVASVEGALWVVSGLSPMVPVLVQ